MTCYGNLTANLTIEQSMIEELTKFDPRFNQSSLRINAFIRRSRLLGIFPCHQLEFTYLVDHFGLRRMKEKEEFDSNLMYGDWSTFLQSNKCLKNSYEYNHRETDLKKNNDLD